MRDFVIARNPEARSKLPFLLHLPLGDHSVWLKAKDSWPRSSRVFCLPAECPSAELEIVARIPVVACRRNGPAIDLILDRGLHRRSQFVFVVNRGRQQIFWQTAKAAKAARPGLRIPYVAWRGAAVYYVDSRERYGYMFAGSRVERRSLVVGDYAVVDEHGNSIAAVERKTIEDFATSLVDGSLSFEMSELATLAHAAVVVEGAYSEILRYPHTPAGYLPELIARLAILYPQVPIVFLEARRIAEQWVRRFLHSAHAHARAPALFPEA